MLVTQEQISHELMEEVKESTELSVTQFLPSAPSFSEEVK